LPTFNRHQPYNPPQSNGHPLTKAELVAVESKRITIKDEFLAYMVMPDGRTVSE
jgi:hypothetical protein